MSRVDEAIRRAAERPSQRNDIASAEPGPIDLQLESLADLANEPFPLEMPERRSRSRTPASSLLRHVPVPADGSRGAAPPPVVQPVPTPGNAASLFERMDESLAEKIVVDRNMGPASREQYRRLAAALHQQQVDRGIRVVMIASAVPGEGKTLTAANLGLTLSESYKRNVLLIDADLRRPALHTVFGTDNRSGLTEGLSATVERKLPARRISERLSLLTGGQPSSDPMASLTSDRMRRLVLEARDAFDWVIIDTPPVAVLPDANLLSSMVDGAVLVIKAGSTSYALVRRAVDAIGKDRILGVVLNDAAIVPQHSYYEYGAYGKTDRTPDAPEGP